MMTRFLKTIAFLPVLLLPAIAAGEGRHLKLLPPNEWQARMAAEALADVAPEDRVNWIAQDASGIAVSGYDLVGYFREGRAVAGRPEFEYELRGVKFRFASEKHRQAFVKDPESFLPQYGGHCAYTLAKGRAVAGHPGAWRILSGKLYFVENGALLATWERDETLLRALAGANWPRMHR